MATIDNKILMYPQNNKSFECLVVGVTDISGYIPYFTVKGITTDSNTVLSKTGIVTDASGTVLFSLTKSDTSIANGDYVYDITIENGTVNYTVVKDAFIITDSVRY